MAKRKQKKLDSKPVAIDPHAAAREGKTATLRAFVASGGDISIRGRGQLLRTPLHIAIESSYEFAVPLDRLEPTDCNRRAT